MDGASRTLALPVAGARATRALLTNVMAYDRIRNVLIVGAASETAQPVLLALEPGGLTTVWSLALPAHATALAVADDGSLAYVGLRNGQVMKLDLATGLTPLTFVISEGRDTGFFPSAMAIRPGSTDTVAVSTSQVEVSGLRKFNRLGVWQNGNPWPQVLEVGPELNNRASAIRFTDADTLVSVDNELSGNVLLKISVGDRTLKALFPGIEGPGGGGKLSLVGSDILLSSGMLIDVADWRASRWLAGLGGSFLALPDLGALGEVALERTDGTGGFEIRFSAIGLSRQEQVRQLRVQLSTLQVSDGRSPEIVDVEGVGAGLVAMQLYEPVTGRAHLVVADFDAVAPMASATPARLQASSEGVDVLALSLPLSEIAYDTSGDRIVGAVPASAGPNGNALVVINPGDGAVEARHLLSSPPARVVVAGAPRVAYVSLPQERAIQQVLLGPGGGLGWKVTGLPGAVLDIAVSPADVETIAFTLDTQGALYIYRSGVRVTAIVGFFPDVRSISSVAFVAADTLVAGDHLTTRNDHQRYRYDGSSVVETGRVPMPPTWRFDFVRYAATVFHSAESWASLDTGLQGGWIMTPEEALDFQGYVVKPYASVTLTDDRSGCGFVQAIDATLHIDRLAPRVVAGSSGDLVGTRRLRILDSNRPSGLPGTVYRTVATGVNRWAALHALPNSGDATLYMFKGL